MSTLLGPNNILNGINKEKEKKKSVNQKQQECIEELFKQGTALVSLSGPASALSEAVASQYELGLRGESSRRGDDGQWHTGSSCLAVGGHLFYPRGLVKEPDTHSGPGIKEAEKSLKEGVGPQIQQITNSVHEQHRTSPSLPCPQSCSQIIFVSCPKQKHRGTEFRKTS